MSVRIKRVYEPPGSDDGLRLLVDRLWPRGIRKEAAAIDQWLKELAPSNELRRWFGHKPERWPEFRRRYSAELTTQAEELDRLRRLARDKDVTLLFGARDPVHNNAAALRDMLGET